MEAHKRYVVGFVGSMVLLLDNLANVAPWLFLSLTIFGVGYLLFGIVIGGFADASFDADMDVGVDGADSEAVGISLNVIAAFCAGFGSIGLTGALLQWNLLLTVLVSLLIGVLIAQGVRRFIGFMMRQQSSNLLTKERLIGLTVRVTINTPAGKVGEGLVQEYERIKYPILHVRGDAMQRNDIVTILSVEGGKLLVE